MAIGFARVEFVKRTEGKNGCGKAAYNSRSKLQFEGNNHQGPRLYDFSWKESPAFHTILLPEGVDPIFKNPEILWNTAEQKEKKQNSQVAIDLVLALPDDKIITLEDRIHLTKTFVQKHFIDQGLGAQIDIHFPDKKLQITQDNKESSLSPGMTGTILQETKNLITVQFNEETTASFNPNEFTGFIEKENNWHAHVLITTRRFKPGREGLSDHKARDLMPRINKGLVISGSDWGKLWTDHQNTFFKQKGIDLSVDTKGIISQEHLGPVRMRGRAFDLLHEHHRLKEANTLHSHDPQNILSALTERQSFFTEKDLEHFLQKHIPFSNLAPIRTAFWKQDTLIPLLDKETGKPLDKFTSQKVIDEEKAILRLSDRLYSEPALKVNSQKSQYFSQTLTPEQKEAFTTILQGQRLSFLQGFAGTGKSHLLKALQDTYLKKGYRVRAFGPDVTTAEVLKQKGLQKTETLHRFLFCLNANKRHILNNKEVWIVDEAGKLGNRPLLELLKQADKNNAQVIFSGDTAQFSSIERGGMFDVFCKKYDPSTLKHIQRQNTQEKRDISKDLATGDFGRALDKLTELQAIRWSSSRIESLETLIDTWAKDTQHTPSSSTLIVAHSNNEVKALNEMVRTIRRHRGELGEKEFACETHQGTLYLSVGDRLEFRKNDKKLGVTNGLLGTLVEVKENRFKVSIKETNNKTRVITFNPQTYHYYQLGYASTYFRSQGKTITQAYVLHSSFTNQKMFYVGLTRHVDKALYFVSKEEVSSLADLKQKASLSSDKETTLSFTTPQDIHLQKEQLLKQEKILSLKNSSSFLNKIKGYGLSIYQDLRSKAGEVYQHSQDLRPNKEFFNIPSQKPLSKVQVTEILAREAKQSYQVSDRIEIVEPPRTQEPIAKSLSTFFTQLQQTKKFLWNEFSIKEQTILHQYFDTAALAMSLRQVVSVEAESNSQDMPSTAHFKEWQKTCLQRNEAAYALVQTLSKEKLTSFLGVKTTNVLQNQSDKYEQALDRSNSLKASDFDKTLKENVKPILYRLFPDGPSWQNKDTFRFGSKGSLSVYHEGSKAGLYYDFERQEGGSVLKLVQRELGLGKLEALAWVKNFMGEPTLIPPRSFQKTTPLPQPGKEWISLKPTLQHPAPKFEEISAGKLQHYFTEVARHAYKNEQGELLHYTLRLQDKNDPTRKITPPLSYGYWKNNPNHSCWELKGPQLDKRSLYNLPHLQENPQAIVLIVEGEKTADQAILKFPKEDFICVTWPFGAKSASLADWTPLAGRKVLIWPDNDKAGFQAAEDICHELRKIGVESLRLVDPIALKEHFPEKWDLADPLPSHLNKELLKDLITSSLHKGIDPEHVLHRVSSYKSDPLGKAKVNEVLFRVDERLRPQLEVQFGKQYWKIHDEILKETCKILQTYSPSSQRGEFTERLTYQTMLFEAKHDKLASAYEVDRMKQIMRDFNGNSLTQYGDKKVAQFSLDRAFTQVYEKNSFERNLIKIDVHKEAICHMESLTKQLEKQNTLEVTKQQMMLNKNKGLDLSR